MLYHLSISNYALIDAADIDFNAGFTVITGETGAGKSILLGALSLILGQRSDVSVLRDKSRKCVVEAGFNLAGYALEDFFRREDVDYEEETLIRREILPTGKSRAFVNDMPVNLAFLKDLANHLIDVHSQHQNLLLGNNDFQLGVVDAVAGNEALLETYRVAYLAYRKVVKQRDALIEQNQKQQADRDYWEFQATQLREAGLKAEEQEELERELQQLSHVEEIKGALATANSLLMEQEFPVLDGLHQIHVAVSKISDYLEEGKEMAERLSSVYIEVKDLARELGDRASSVEFDPQRIRVVQDRLDLLYSLQQKHHVDNNVALLELLDNLEKKLGGLDAFDEDLEELNKEVARQEIELGKLAEVLTLARQKVFEVIQQRIEGQLADLGMPNARLRLQHQDTGTYGEQGRDLVQFLFSANKNGELCDIPKVASGGELSRLMLCIKALLTSARSLPTLIFDEIDTGVSGEIADRMGRIMLEMGQRLQVISITHLPQIAGKGQHHFKVFKRDTEEHTLSEIEVLDADARVLEIAGMLSGAELSEAALSNAREFLK